MFYQKKLETRADLMNWTITVGHIQGKFNILADQLFRNTTISTVVCSTKGIP